MYVINYVERGYFYHIGTKSNDATASDPFKYENEGWYAGCAM